LCEPLTTLEYQYIYNLSKNCVTGKSLLHENY